MHVSKTGARTIKCSLGVSFGRQRYVAGVESPMAVGIGALQAALSWRNALGPGFRMVLDSGVSIEEALKRRHDLE